MGRQKNKKQNKSNKMMCSAELLRSFDEQINRKRRRIAVSEMEG